MKRKVIVRTRCARCGNSGDDVRLIRMGWLCAACADPPPDPGPIVPSPMIDVMEGYDRMAWNYERRKEVPR